VHATRAFPSSGPRKQNANSERYTDHGPWLCVASPGITAGWGLLSQQNLVALAEHYESNRDFLDKHYFYIYPFSFRDTEQNVSYPPALANILFLNAAQVP
jgi:hypothetical protein